jgi:hypothetical protein
MSHRFPWGGRGTGGGPGGGAGAGAKKAGPVGTRLFDIRTASDCHPLANLELVHNPLLGRLVRRQVR